MDENELNRRLDALVSDDPPRVWEWDDVARGRAARRRRRVASSVGAASFAACALAIGLWAGLPPGQNFQPAAGSPTQPAMPEFTWLDEVPKLPESYVAPPSDPRAPEYVPERVTPTEAVQRCIDAVSMSVPTISADPAAMPSGPLYAGDPAEIPFLPNDSDAGGCSIVSGPLAPVAYPYLATGTTANDTDAILTACSDRLRIDFHAWTVASAMSDGYGGFAAALVSPGQGYFVSCELEDPELNGWSDVSIINHTSLPALHNMTVEESEASHDGLGAFPAHYSGCYPVTSGCVGESTSLVGVLPRGMESATVLVGDGTELTVPVGVDGTYAIRFVSPRGALSQIRTYDAAGVEVGTWPLRSS